MCTTAMNVSQLIPMRFMALMGHFVFLVTLLSCREDTVRLCVDWRYGEPSAADLQAKDIEMITGFSLGIGFLVIELLGFLSGISMFFPLHSFLSLIAHAGACITLGYFVTDVWDCSMYWWIFAICTVLPTTSEIAIIFSVAVLKRVF